MRQSGNDSDTDGEIALQPSVALIAETERKRHAESIPIATGVDKRAEKD
jgi:hypothetical protein